MYLLRVEDGRYLCSSEAGLTLVDRAWPLCLSSDFDSDCPL
jgi:hypothetical protein